MRRSKARSWMCTLRCWMHWGTVLVALATAPALAQVRTVWQIGTFDDNSREFRDSHGLDYAHGNLDVNYVVGKSTEQDWLRFQPGPANGIAGGRLHPFHITFSLPEAPRGVYILKVVVLYETPRLSALRVDMNGHWGQFTFAPRLDHGAGDWEGTFVPQTSAAERSIMLPANWMHKGENVITLTAVDDPATVQNSLGDIAPGESGLVYDALALEQNETQQYSDGEIEPTAKATIFFRQGQGGLREVVRACVEVHAGGQLPTEIMWTSKNFHDTKTLNFGQAEFGENCTEFDVPEWTGTLEGHLQVGDTTRAVTLAAQKKWTLLIVPHEHLDIGFTDYREKVAELQSQSIDGVLDLLPQHPEFRWTMDGSWIAQQYLAGRSPERIEQFFSAVRAGKIVIPSQFSSFAGRLVAFALSLSGVSEGIQTADWCSQHYGCAIVFVVVCVNFAFCGYKVFCCRKQFMACSHHAARTMEREVSLLLGGSGWRARADVVLESLSATGLSSRNTADSGSSARCSAGFLAGL